jgi:hypothetical protein
VRIELFIIFLIIKLRYEYKFLPVNMGIDINFYT